MSSVEEKRCVVFYSWQSDLHLAVNQKLIRNALNEAAHKLNADAGANLHVTIDEATRKVPGSPDIKAEIFDKIKNADVFACDLTKVTEFKSQNGEFRKFCNPNVAIELGYAIRVLGWKRIVTIFNTAYGKLPDDLPFDAKAHRATPYKCVLETDFENKLTALCEKGIQNSIGSLRTTLIEALKLIIDDDPVRPEDADEKSPEQIRRERDLRQLKEVFHWIHLNTIDMLADDLCYGRIRDVVEGQNISLVALINSSRFHINDARLNDLVVSFGNALNACFKYAGQMDRHVSNLYGHFKLPGDMFVSKDQEKWFRYTQQQSGPLKKALDELCSYVREKYVEIDLAQSGVDAVREHWRQVEELKELASSDKS